MGLFDFVKSAGAMLGIGKDEPPAEDALKAEISKHDLKVDGLDVKVDGDTVKVSGKTLSQEEKEKVILALGNVAGVAKVEDNLQTEGAAPEAVFYTVKSGDNLSKIAKVHYGNANQYMKIFEANRPMLSDPDKIYPGQVLRIPQS
ncbi:MAG: peptidoglycan-binding protein LysM [Hyphomicrobiales bacterium]|nr:peptidoglycan-binding protein LysM [Hyphomicrobiales bacterium]